MIKIEGCLLPFAYAWVVTIKRMGEDSGTRVLLVP